MDQESKIIQARIAELKTSARLIADKIRVLTSERAIKYMEEDLIAIDTEITQLIEKEKENQKQIMNIEEVTQTVKYFLEHLEDLLLQGSNPEQKAHLFSLLFEEAPSYEELILGTPKLAPYIALNNEFTSSNFPSVTPRGFEPRIAWMKTKSPRPLDDGAGDKVF